MKIHKEIEQLSPEWFKLKLGRLSASKAQSIGNCGKGLDSYVIQLMAEYYSNGEKEHYTNEHIERGVELEKDAVLAYEFETGQEVEKVGFIEYNNFVGCSPDGLVGKDGGIEIKCTKDDKHFKMILDGEKEIESAYIWQIQMTLLITGRKWWDYVNYNPNFDKSLLVFRQYPDKVKQDKLLKGIEIGIEKIKEIHNKLK